VPVYTGQGDTCQQITKILDDEPPITNQNRPGVSKTSATAQSPLDSSNKRSKSWLRKFHKRVKLQRLEKLSTLEDVFSQALIEHLHILHDKQITIPTTPPFFKKPKPPPEVKPREDRLTDKDSREITFAPTTVITIPQEGKGKPKKKPFFYTVRKKHHAQNASRSAPKPKDGITLLQWNMTALGTVREDGVFKHSPAQNYIQKATQCHAIHGLLGQEHHKIDTKTVETFLRKINMIGSVTPAKQTSDKGTHGGEISAFNKNLDCVPVPPEVLAQVEKDNQFSNSTAASIMTIKGATFIVASIYLTVGEELSEQNYNKLLMAKQISSILKLPIMILGDFNIHSQALIESGWLTILDLVLVTPKYKKDPPNRIIDYLVCSRELEKSSLDTSRTGMYQMALILHTA